MKKGWKIALSVVGGLLGLLILVTLLAGPIAKHYVEKHSKELCNRVATVDKIGVNLFTGTVAIYSLNIQEEDDKSSFLYFDKLKVNMSLARLLGKTVRISQIELDGLKAAVIQNGSAFNFDDILALYADDDEDDDDTTSSWTIDLRKITIRNSNLAYRDAQVGSKFGLKNIALNIPRLYFSGQNTDIGLDLNFDKGGRLSVKMLYDMEKGHYNLKVKLSKFQLAMIQPYLTQSMNVEDVRGTLSGNVELVGSLEHILQTAVKGNISLDEVTVANADKSPLLAISSLQLKGIDIDLAQSFYQVGEVSLDGWQFCYDVYAANTTLDRIFKPSSATPDSTRPDTATSKPLRYWVHKVSIGNGTVRYADHALTPRAMNYQAGNITLKVKDLQNGKPSPITLTATLGKTGQLLCNGNIDVMDLSNASLNVSIKNLNIKDFTPYALHYLAYPVEGGLLSFQSENVIRKNWLNSRNAIDIFKPTFGKKDKAIKPAAANLPMKAAMYIITDRKGHVQMDLPVKGDLSSPEFSFTKIIWKTVANLMVKIMASPIDFIAKIAGSENTFRPIEMAASQLQLSMEQLQQLNEIASVLQQKEEMSLTIQSAASLPFDTMQTDAAALRVREQNLASQSRQLIMDYLQTQGVAANRIMVVTDPEIKVKEGQIKTCFNLKMPE